MTTELLITELESLVKESQSNSYRKGEIIVELSTHMDKQSLREVCTHVGIAKSQAHNLSNIVRFGSQEEVELVGYNNVLWLMKRANEERRQEVYSMLEQGEDKETIQSRIGEMKDEAKQERPVKVDPRDEMIAMMSQHIRELWLEKLGDTLPVAIQELIAEEEEEARLEEERKEMKPTATTKTGREIQQKFIDAGMVKTPSQKEEDKHEEDEPTMEVIEQETTENIQEELPTIQEEKVENDPLAFLSRPTNALARFRNAQPKEEEVVTRPAWLGFETDNDAFTETYA